MSTSQSTQVKGTPTVEAMMEMSYATRKVENDAKKTIFKTSDVLPDMICPQAQFWEQEVNSDASFEGFEREFHTDNKDPTVYFQCTPDYTWAADFSLLSADENSDGTNGSVGMSASASGSSTISSKFVPPPSYPVYFVPIVTRATLKRKAEEVECISPAKLHEKIVVPVDSPLQPEQKEKKQKVTNRQQGKVPKIIRLPNGLSRIEWE